MSNKEYTDVISKFVKQLDVYAKHKNYIIKIAKSVGVDVNSPEIKSFLEVFTEDEYIRMLTEIYSKYFTLEEIIKVVEWQTSELGRKCAKNMHVIEEDLYVEMSNLLTLAMTPSNISN